MNENDFLFDDDAKEQLAKRLSRLRGKMLWEPNFDGSNAISLLDLLNSFTQNNESVITFGRVVKLHNFGQLVFGQLRYEVGEIEFKLSSRETTEFESTKQEIQLGDIIWIKGKTGWSKRHEPQLTVNEFRIISPCFISHFPENINTRRIYMGMTTHLDLVISQKIRSLVLKCLRTYLNDEMFEEQFTPIMTKVFYGGRSHPFTTYYRSENREMYLRVTAEIGMRMLLAGGLSRIYEIGPSFRNETRDSLHIAPFMLLEAYAPYTAFEKMVSLCENLLGAVINAVAAQFGNRVMWLDETRNNPITHFKNISCNQIILDTLNINVDVQTDVERLAQLCGNDIPKNNEQRAFLIVKALKNHIVPKLAEPTIVSELPSGLSPFIQDNSQNHTKLNRAYIIIKGVQIAEVFEGQTDPIKLLEALKTQAATRNEDNINRDYSDVIHSIMFGLPPISVMDISIERLLMIFCDEIDVRNITIDL